MTAVLPSFEISPPGAYGSPTVFIRGSARRSRRARSIDVRVSAVAIVPLGPVTTTCPPMS
jgi:hypothetical protein